METKTIFVRTNTLPKMRVRSEEVSDDSSTETPEEIGAEIESQFGPAKSRKYSRSVWLVVLGLLVLAGGASFVAIEILPAASVHVTVKKQNFAFANVVSVDKAIRENDLSAMKVPGQIFSEKKNVTLTLPALGKKFVSKKATGKMTVYNGYSSEPQKLVASTRFITPDEKIFRLANAVTVPGAKIVDGKIVPSSVEITVVADKAGEEYNIGPTSRFEIPGFKGTVRYGAFYGDSVAPMFGGYIGELAYPTDDDIRKGKIEIARVLEDGARTVLQSKMPADFKAVENAFVFSIGKQTINSDVNSAGQFSIFAEADMSLMAFRAVDVENLLRARAIHEIGSDYVIRSNELTYGVSRVDMAAGKMTVAVDYKAVLARDINVEDLRTKMLGKSESELQAIFLTVAEFVGARIEFNHFWVKSIPERSSKVEVIVD